MNRIFKITLCLAVVFATLLTAGCGKSAKEQYGSAPFFIQSAIAMVDSLKAVLPKKDIFELGASCGKVGGALKGLPNMVSSPAAKAKAEKISDMFEKDLRPTILGLQYDAPTIAKKLDEIRATLVELGKEVQ